MRALNGERWQTPLGLGAVALVAVVILGYHPYSEDGGIYAAEIKRALDSRLYPHETAFVAGHLGWSGFTAGVVWVVRTLGWRLEWVMLGLQVLSVLGVLVGVWLLARQCYPDKRALWGAVGTVGLCLTVPVAGTSLLLMDPYVTARSVCLALTVLGLGGLGEFLNDRGLVMRWKPLVWSLVALAGAVTVHPLMGGYGVGAAAMLVCGMSGRAWVRTGGIVGLSVAATLVAWGAQVTAQPETADYVSVAATRYYWFLARWQWFEVAGLVAPLCILGWVGWKGSRGTLEGGLARMSVSVGAIGVAIALGFAHEGGLVHAVARMQPLRCFQVVYVVMFTVLGGLFGERVLRGSVWRWTLAMVAVGGLMVWVQQQTYPASGHFELPGTAVRNGWERAFLWVRENTPKDALFGLDADYVKAPGEDAQGFRAVAERSALPDYSKDGGQAAIRPELTESWIVGQRAQTGLTEATDEERVQALGALGATWVVMRREGVTGFACPYERERVKVCRLP